MKFTLLIGMPGSGKTYYGNSLKYINSIFIDDIKDKSLLLNLSYDHIIIADPNFCIPEILTNAVRFINSNYNTSIEFVYFENDVDKCFANVINRNDNRIISDEYLKFLSSKYVIPDKITPIKVWSKDA